MSEPEFVLKGMQGVNKSYEFDNVNAPRLTSEMDEGM